LWGVHLEKEINWQDTPELMNAAARKSLIARGNEETCLDQFAVERFVGNRLCRVRIASFSISPEMHYLRNIICDIRKIFRSNLKLQK
jgi:hypothetical protein